MSDKMMRIAGRNDGGTAKAINVDEQGNIGIKQARMEVIKLNFGGNETPIINDTNRYISQAISISKYKSIEFIVRQKVQAEIGILIYENVDNRMHGVNFYDWNTEEWVMGHWESVGSHTARPIILPSRPSEGLETFYNLTTHPDLYWLKDLNATQIQLRFQAMSEPVASETNEFEVWLVGELNV